MPAHVDRGLRPNLPPGAAAAKQDAEIESIEDVIDMGEIRDHLRGAVEALKQDLSRLRPGRADAKMLDHLEVSAYGALQPMTAVAQVTVKHQGLVVMPFDPSVRQPAAHRVARARSPRARAARQRHHDGHPRLGDGAGHAAEREQHRRRGPEADQGDAREHGQDRQEAARERARTARPGGGWFSAAR